MCHRRFAQVERKSALGWGRLSLRRVVGFGGCVCGGKPSTNEITNARMNDVQMEVRFGVGEAVRAAGCGFRRARLWGKSVHE
jgi:hypothetical protein